jgi:6-phosphofructokinase 2
METLDEQKTALRQVREQYDVQLPALTLGPDGGILCSGDHMEHVPSPDVEIRSPVGAGDCTVAGIVQALAEGRTELEAFRFGLSCGASAVSTPGHELCRREHVEELLATLPNP